MDHTFTSGKLWKQILLFALPLAASSILQQLFNSADVAVVGQFAGSTALAAVGANGAIINLLVNSFVGLSVGSNVVISNYIGQEREDLASLTIYTSIVLALFTGVILLIIGMILAPIMLEMISTPIDILDLSILYLRIYFIGVPFIMLYNFEAAILRSYGNTSTPLIALFISGIVNVLLNLFFVVICHMSVEGVAIATVISNVVSTSILLFYLLKNHIINLKEITYDFKILKQILRIGLPASLQGAVFSLSNLIIQNSVNGFGKDAIAGSTAAVNFEIMAYYVLNAFEHAAVTFIGQNHGAKEYQRCKDITKWCFIEGIFFTGLLSILFLVFDDPLVHIFTKSEAVAELAKIRMFTLLAFETLNVCIEVLSGTMRGYGYSLTPALITIAGVCGVRILWIYTIVSKYHTFNMLMYCYPVSWAFTLAGLIISYIVIRKKVGIDNG